MKIKVVGKLSASYQRRIVYSINGLSPSLMAGMGGGGGMTPFIVIKRKNYERYEKGN